jgi:short-subunit dehydrogenase
MQFHCIKLKTIKMNKTIFITGASSGLGKATAKLFAAKGWTVIGTMRNPDEESELTEIPNIHLLKLDLSNANQIAKIAAEAEKISPIDVLLNNAAYGLMGPFEGTSEEQLAQQINTNFLGTLLVSKAFLPYFRARKSGTIITVTSSTANIPYPFVAVYAATKSALETWTEGMSYELDGFGIRIKTIVPAYMQTNFGKNAAMVSHQAYQETFDQYIMAMKADSSAKRDTPESIAGIVFEAATDNTKQLHYTAGHLSTKEYDWLKKEGIEEVISTMNKRFFDREN